MLARRYEARSVGDALALVREDLGHDAVVLYSRERSGPWWRFWDAHAEVIAMAPPGAEGRAPRGEPVSSAPSTSAAPTSTLPALEDAPSPQAPRAASSPRRVACAAPIRLQAGRSRRVALVGATGVGKTTTIAKLATIHALRGARVGLLAADAVRMGAVEQLAGYARVLRLPTARADEPAAAARAAARLASADLVLVDLPGVSPSDALRLAAVRDLLEAIRPHEVHLVLPATAHVEVIVACQEGLMGLCPTRAIVTHVDEAPAAHLATVLDAIALPLSYLGLGPNVPDDLVSARSRKASAWLGAA